MLNKIMLIGNLGRDPELNVTAEGTPVTKFSLAVNRKYKTGTGELNERPNGSTSWFGGSLPRSANNTCIKAQKCISKADSRSESTLTRTGLSAPA